jgi:hypothetical protein
MAEDGDTAFFCPVWIGEQQCGDEVRKIGTRKNAEPGTK